jgi:hypothetical protein
MSEKRKRQVFIVSLIVIVGLTNLLYNIFSNAVTAIISMVISLIAIIIIVQDMRGKFKIPTKN